MPMLNDDEINDFMENVLSADERSAINAALRSDDPWKHKQFPTAVRKQLESAKDKIRDFHRERTNHKCCYCCRSLLNANIETDREHIVPKGLHKLLAYEIFNLSVACKRCNMTYKGQTVGHIIKPETIPDDLKNPDRYRIPHPNIDSYDDHVKRKVVQDGSIEWVHYELKTDKGHFLYDFVQLQHLEIDQFNLAQGGTKAPVELGIIIPSAV